MFKDLLHYDDLTKLGYGSRATIYRKVQAGKFPPPIDSGFGSPAWLPDDLKNWAQSRPRLTPQQIA